jgi:hypothetical protein
MLTLADVKAHLKLDPADISEDALLTGLLAAAVGTFRTISKRRWPVPHRQPARAGFCRLRSTSGAQSR